MSLEYDEYLKEHIRNVKRGLEWMRDKLELTGDDITNAIYEAENHDHSKWGASEYDQYDKYFYGGNRSYQVVLNFNYAWLHHQHRNPHHWQYWILINDDPEEGNRAMPMPMVYIYEMIADWWTFSWKNGNLFEIFDWYDAHKDYILLERSTRIVVEDLLKRMKEKLELDAATDYIEGIELQHSDEDDEAENKIHKYGVPEQKKFPLPDAGHVRSAIRFFNYVEPRYEEELAKAILMRAKEYGVDISKINVGDENRFKKYLPKENNSLEHSGVKGQKWGVKNGPPYPLDTSKIANDIYEKAKNNSGKVLNDVKSAVSAAGGKMYGEENMLKSKESIERKLNKKIEEDGISASEAAEDIKDAIRFTMIADEDRYVDAYNEFKNNMESKGYTEARCKNYFDLFDKGEVKHKAVQSTFKTGDGYEFEIQFHTPASQDAKNKKIPLYNERRTVGIDPSRARELEKQMEDLALNVNNPIGIEKIKSHS